MITKEKLSIYKYFNGDIDAWARIGSVLQKQAIKDADWVLIESLLQDIVLVKKGLVSKDYLLSINTSLKENCDNAETIQELNNMANW